MSDYEYDDQPRRRSTRVRDRDPEYVRETTYVERGKGVPSRDLVYRPREDSIEDIPRDFPPPGAEYRRTKDRYYDDDDDYPPRRSRSDRRRSYYDDDYYSDYGPAPAAAAGAAAGYAAGRARGRRDKYSRDDGYYSDDYDNYERQEKRPKPQRRKSTVEKTLEDLGLGGVVGAVTSRLRSKSRSRKDRSRSRSSSYDRYSEAGGRRRSRSRGGDSRQKWEQAAKAAVIAGAVEAWRARKVPGAWTGEKGQRIATAALGSAGIDALVDKNPDKKGKRHIAESVVGGLLANRAVNGPRSESRGRSRSRSRAPSLGERLRSRSRSIFGRGGGSQSPNRGRSSGIKDLAAAGGLAAVGKAIYDRVRSKSRGRDRRSRSRSSSADSYVPHRQSRYARDRGPQPDDDYQDDRVARPRGRAAEDAVAAGGVGAAAAAIAHHKRDSSSDTVSTTDLENRRKKSRGKELLTAGLATVATIHAAHGVYSSMVASDKRHKMVMEGEMTPEQARKAKSKNMLQDAAAVGIAALGIKSAFTEWKEMNEKRHEVHELEEKRRKRNKNREKRQREQRQLQKQMMLANGSANQWAASGYNGPSNYADANPYGSVPPPPMGAPQRY